MCELLKIRSHQIRWPRNGNKDKTCLDKVHQKDRLNGDD